MHFAKFITKVENTEKELIIYAELERKEHHCISCGTATDTIHGYRKQVIKDIPADRLLPRARFKKSLDEILNIPYNKEKVYVTLESKVFGIGLESYTAGSAEFCLSYSDYKGTTPLETVEKAADLYDHSTSVESQHN